MKVVLNILTHGDETAGIAIAARIKKHVLLKGELIIHRANQLAYAKRKRFIDQDLNRSFPGKQRGNHEQKLAYSIRPLIKSADLVIDIHTTRSGLRDSLIVTKLTKRTREYADVIAPRYGLIMNPTKKNALISEAKVGIAFEYGGNTERTVREVTAGIERLLRHLGMILSTRRPLTRETQWFNVHSSVLKPKGAILLRGIRNYKLLPKGKIFARTDSVPIRADQDFYPILFGENSYRETFGFAATKLS